MFYVGVHRNVIERKIHPDSNLDPSPGAFFSEPLYLSACESAEKWQTANFISSQPSDVDQMQLSSLIFVR